MSKNSRHQLERPARKRVMRALSDEETLLITGQGVALILGCSLMTVKRMRWEGKLQAIQLRPGPTSPFLYNKSDVYALAGARMPKPSNA